jgi:hypothetical protein
MFETAQLMIQQNAALSNPQAPAPAAKPELTPEQCAARRQRQINDGWQALHERYQREAGSRKTF